MLFRSIERDNGRVPEEKVYGVVRMDLDLLRFDDEVLKPNDMKQPHVLEGMKELGL